MRNSGITPYNLILPPALFILKQIGKVQEKVGLFFSLRRSVFTELEAATVTISSGRFRMWVHAASVGEFEQARPVISALKKSHPDIAVFVSFLSDSGYNARKTIPTPTPYSICRQTPLKMQKKPHRSLRPTYLC